MRTPVELAYFSGFFDGEGSIIIYERSTVSCPSGYTMPHNLRVCLSNTDKEIMQWIKKEFGGSLQPYRKAGNHARAWKWTISCRAAGDLLKQILPYLKVKRTQAEVAIAFQDDVTQWKKKGHIKGTRGQMPVPEEKLAYRSALAQKLRDIRHHLKNS